MSSRKTMPAEQIAFGQPDFREAGFGRRAHLRDQLGVRALRPAIRAGPAGKFAAVALRRAGPGR